MKRITGLLVASAIAATLSAGCSHKPPDEKGYTEAIATDRATKDQQFRTESGSPIPADKRNELLPLSYFPVDPDYHVAASLKPTDDPTIIEMVTSTGGKERMRRGGTLEFSLRSQPLKLTAFIPADSPRRLFVPFTDLTTGTETYPGGRYLDLDRNATNIYMIDFNRAYHPYCYYSPTWECPYPPAENRLKVPIRAGERLKHPNT